MPEKRSSLQTEIRQTKPFQSPAQEAILALFRTSDLLERRLAQMVEPRGISLQQYNVLRILRGAGQEGTPTLDIADRMIQRAPGITRLLDKLAAKRLVRRERCSEDRRQVLCWVTDAGLRLLADLEQPLVKSGTRAMDSLAAAEQRHLIAMLERVRGGLD
jgi:MarR family transcriptional regulator, organic hydroperoxide resistance regulator